MNRNPDGREERAPTSEVRINLTGEMRCHLSGDNTAVLRFSESCEAFVLDLVLVPSESRGQGVGTMLIERLLHLADSQGKPVHTTARPIGQNTPGILTRLIHYYERFGFQVSQRGVSSAFMVRRSRGAGR